MYIFQQLDKRHEILDSYTNKHKHKRVQSWLNDARLEVMTDMYSYKRKKERLTEHKKDSQSDRRTDGHTDGQTGIYG